MALLSHAMIGERRLSIYNLHLESRERDELRRSQLAEVLNDALRCGAEVPVIVAGDFNFNMSKPGNACLTLEKGFHNPFADLGLRTARAHSFGRSNTIDWVLTRGPIATVSPKIDHSVSASDHFPLSLILELQAASQHHVPKFGPLSAYGH
jgi:endonuclease/exonuclease/phosphatase family metal-dependent hydrolase